MRPTVVLLSHHWQILFSFKTDSASLLKCFHDQCWQSEANIFTSHAPGEMEPSLQQECPLEAAQQITHWRFILRRKLFLLQKQIQMNLPTSNSKIYEGSSFRLLSEKSTSCSWVLQKMEIVSGRLWISLEDTLHCFCRWGKKKWICVIIWKHLF